MQQTKTAVIAPGEFDARLFLINASPDADCDSFRPGCLANSKARVSLREHDTMVDPTLDPAGEAELREERDAVYAYGRVFDTQRGQQLRATLAANGGAQEWSIGYIVRKSRAPTADEAKRHPDLKRVILRVEVEEISPVTRGACGPTCRTLGAKTKCVTGCTCGTAEAAAVATVLAETRRVLAKTEATLDALDWPPTEVRAPDADRAQRAGFAAAVAGKLLGIPTPRVKWFHRTGATNGMAHRETPGVVWLAHDLPARDVPEIVLHEAKHTEQHGRRFGDVKLAEPGVRAFGKHWGPVVTRAAALTDYDSRKVHVVPTAATPIMAPAVDLETAEPGHVALTKNGRLWLAEAYWSGGPRMGWVAA